VLRSAALGDHVLAGGERLENGRAGSGFHELDPDVDRRLRARGRASPVAVGLEVETFTRAGRSASAAAPGWGARPPAFEHLASL
jgi:hypothetical protein